MRRTVCRALAGLLLALGAQPASADADALDWLRRMDAAAREQTYQGTFLFAHGEKLATMHILHQGPATGEEREKLVAMDGVAREVLRTGDELACMQPGQADADSDACYHAAPFARAFVHDVELLRSNYGLSLGASDRIAGREAIQLMLQARDQHRHSYRLWLDRDTSLLLMCLMQDADGEVLERFQFTQLDFPEQIPAARFRFDGDGVVVRRQLPAEDDSADMPQLTWQVGWLPDGFVATHGMAANAVHLGARVFTDGLALLSVFVDRADASLMEGVSKMGATVALTRRLDDGPSAPFVTVAGELPEATVRRVAGSVRLREE